MDKILICPCKVGKTFSSDDIRLYWNNFFFLSSTLWGFSFLSIVGLSKDGSETLFPFRSHFFPKTLIKHDLSTKTPTDPAVFRWWAGWKGPCTYQPCQQWCLSSRLPSPGKGRRGSTARGGSVERWCSGAFKGVTWMLDGGFVWGWLGWLGWGVWGCFGFVIDWSYFADFSKRISLYLVLYRLHLVNACS